MKKYFILLIILFLPLNIYADEVKFSKCVDGDTARFIKNNKEIKVRFLGIDTPETVKPNTKVQPYGKEASNYTCKKLKNANKIELEYEPNSLKEDKYGRTLAYVFVDNNFLEEELLKNGYAKVKYINKKYKYYDRLLDAEDYARINSKGLFSDGKTKSTKEENIDNQIDKDISKLIKKLLSNIFKEIFN